MENFFGHVLSDSALTFWGVILEFFCYFWTFLWRICAELEYAANFTDIFNAFYCLINLKVLPAIILLKIRKLRYSNRNINTVHTPVTEVMITAVKKSDSKGFCRRKSIRLLFVSRAHWKGTTHFVNKYR